MAKKQRGHAGGHGWFVTFADLMALLMSFFVMLVAFSTQDSAKLQVVAGSMRDAFGVQNEFRYSGIIEVDGIPTRPRLKNVANVPPQEASQTPSPDERGRASNFGSRTADDGAFALAAATLRSALQDLPEIAEISKQIVFEETKDGLNIEIIDQDGRAMFAEGAKQPTDRTRRVLERLAGRLKLMPQRISISGHTAAGRRPPRPGYTAWDLSADRANAVRQVLEDEGVPVTRFFMVAGRADTQPLYPEDASMSSNRRVTITLMRESPAMPPGFKP